MAGDVAVHRAVVHAGAAADATQHAPELAGQDLAAAVVHHDDVNLGGAVRLTGLGSAGVHLERRGDLGTDGAGHQQGNQRVERAQVGHDALGAHHHDLRFGNRGCHAGVALISYQSARARFGHAEVAARNAHLGAQELLAQVGAQELGNLLGGIGAGVALLLAVQIANGIAVEVQRRHNDVRGFGARRLQDVLGAVGFHCMDAVLFQVLVQAHLFGDHGFRLHAARGLNFLEDVERALDGVLGRGREVHLGSCRLGVFGEFADVVIQVLQNMVANVSRFPAKLLPQGVGIGALVAVAHDGFLRAFDRVVLEVVGKGILNALAQRSVVVNNGRRCHGLLPLS